MIRPFFLVCAGLILFQSETALALTGNELKGYLGNDVGLNKGIAYGYMEGVIDARAREICLPNGVSKGQMIDIVVNYLNAHPEVLHQPADDIVFFAITKAWPCK